MKRILASTLSVLFAGALLSLAGCDGGGIRPGMPDNTVTPDAPLLEADMATGSTPPPSVTGKAPPKGTDSGAPVEVEKGKVTDGTEK